MIMSWTKTIANKYVVHQCICLFCYILQTGAMNLLLLESDLSTTA